MTGLMNVGRIIKLHTVFHSRNLYNMWSKNLSQPLSFSPSVPHGSSFVSFGGIVPDQSAADAVYSVSQDRNGEFTFVEVGRMVEFSWNVLY